MDPLTKTWVSLGLVFLVLFNFWTAMEAFGSQKKTKNVKLMMRLHRIRRYVFLIYFIWISWVCFDLMARLAQAGKPLDVRGFYHGFLAFAVFGLLLLKLSFIRFYRKYQPHVKLLGIIISLATIIIWAIAGGMSLILLA
jgi:hypothetical protein